VDVTTHRLADSANRARKVDGHGAGGGIRDPLNGALFDLAGGYRPLFLMMASYATLAFLTVMFIPRGAGEAASV
jgi:hypothetical protein